MGIDVENRCKINELGVNDGHKAMILFVLDEERHNFDELDNIVVI